MTAGVSGQRTNDGDGTTEDAARRFPWLLAILLWLSLLTLPIFAHGCHGDDVDHEPGFAPPVAESTPEPRP